MKWVLASGSPRRKVLFGEIIEGFEIINPAVDEIDPPEYDPAELVLHNAQLKLEAVCRLASDVCVLAADTTVAIGNKIFNKPRDIDDARRMLNALSGRIHHVYTGVCVWTPVLHFQFVESSSVDFKQLNDSIIETYISKTRPFDKAGAYGIQDHGEIIIERYTGSFNNIMGLPTERLREEFYRHGIPCA